MQGGPFEIDANHVSVIRLPEVPKPNVRRGE
jgi:hypothetical protein